MKVRQTLPAAAALALAAVALLAACNPQDGSAPAAGAARQDAPATTANTPAGPATPAAQATPAAAHSDGVRRVPIAEARAMAERGEAVIYDVRDRQAYEASRVKGAKLVPLGEVAARAAEFPKDKLVITYCAWPAENTSARAAQMLKEKGYENVAAMLGGWNAWTAAGYPTEKGK